MKKLRQTQNIKEKSMTLLFAVFGFLAVVLVLLITLFLFISGIPAIADIGLGDFMFGRKWAPTAEDSSFGILPFILSSMYGTVGAITIGVPVGLFCSIFLAKIAPRRLAAFTRSAVELLSGIPSVVYGLIGMIVIVPYVRDLFNLPDGATLFSAIIVLSIMILPSVISVSETAIRAVSKEYEEGSLALGATMTETVFKVTLPAAKSGIISAIILGIGRAIGETMAVMMVAGNISDMPRIFGGVRFLTTAIASEMAYSSGLHRKALFSVALVLFVFILIINLVLNIVVKRKKR